MLALIDYGLSNLRSVQKAFEHVGAAVQLTSDPQEVARADKLILPGVGAFAAGMEGLRRRGLIEALRAAASAGVPILGICLGMELLFDESEEMGRHAGLGLISGRVLRFPPGLRAPHVGWNQLQPGLEGRAAPHPLLAGVAPGAYAYFVHSYFCRPDDPSATLAVTDYGGAFASIVARDHVIGMQFHPEKSQAVGLTLLRNFVAL